MKIILSHYGDAPFGEYRSFDDANLALFWKHGCAGDICYKIEVEGASWSGRIDMEPASFHEYHKKTILTEHLRNYWGNVAANPIKPFIGITDDFKTAAVEMMALLSFYGFKNKPLSYYFV